MEEPKEKERDETTVTIGNWLVSISSATSGKKSMVPRVEMENLLTGQIVSYKIDKKSSGSLVANPNVPVPLSDGTLVTTDNCVELFEIHVTALLKQRKEAPKPAPVPESGEEPEETEEERDVKKCLLVLANYLVKILANNLLRKTFLEIISKDALIELTKSDWLVLKNEYDLYKFCKAWATLRVRRAMGIPDPDPSLDEDMGKGKEKLKDDSDDDDDNGKGKEKEKDKDKEDDKGKEKEKDKDDKDKDGDKDKDDADSDEKEKERLKKEKEEKKKKKKERKELPEWQKTPEFRKLMNEQLAGIIENIRFPMMTHMGLSHMEEEPFDVPLNLLTEAYRYHLYADEKFYKKNKYVKGAQCRSRRYMAIKWDPKKKASQIDLSKDHLTISSAQSCAHKTILGVHGFSSGKNSWEIKLNGQAGCYSATGVARKNFKVDGGILGIEPDSWAFRLYPGTHCQTGDRRKEDASGGTLNAGDLVKIDLDMDRGRLIISVNGAQKATWKGLTGTLYPALSICHQSGNEGYTLQKT